MSDMNGNPHVPDAESYINEASLINDWPRGEREVQAVSAQAFATLALAYEQRTANLIAYVDKIDDTSAAIPVVNEIKSRLGIKEKED